MRLLLGPGRWMLIVYEHLEAGDRVVVVAIHDDRDVTTTTGVGERPALAWRALCYRASVVLTGEPQSRGGL